MTARTARHVVVDGANVVGSRPDGWWRDRPGAAERLAARLAAALDAGTLDSGTPDAGTLDAGTPDSGTLDAGAAEAGAGPDRAAADGLGPSARDHVTVHLVLEGRARAAEPPPHPHLRVVRADADGDDAIVALTRDLGGRGVVVVTADRALRDRVRALGATCSGPATLLAALPGP